MTDPFEKHYERLWAEECAAGAEMRRQRDAATARAEAAEARAREAEVRSRERDAMVRVELLTWLRVRLDPTNAVHREVDGWLARLAKDIEREAR